MDILDYQTLLLQIIILLLVATVTVGAILIYYFFRISGQLESHILAMRSKTQERRQESPRVFRETGYAAPVEVIPPITVPPPVRKTETETVAPIHNEQDLTQAPVALTGQPPPGSLNEIKMRYSLDELTLATEDGLLIESTEPDHEGHAARYSMRYSETGEGWEDGAFIFSLIHKGSTVIGMAGSAEPLADSTRASVIKDVRAILSKMI
jgi:hypothetical protein